MNQKTVLIVEDTDKNLKLFTFLVGSLGHRVLAAHDGEEGVALARTHLPDLVLMDIQMPKMDGVTAQKMLKADPATQHIPVIAITSYAMKGDRERLLAEGFTHYIPKPIEKDLFLADIRRLIGGPDEGSK